MMARTNDGGPSAISGPYRTKVNARTARLHDFISTSEFRFFVHGLLCCLLAHGFLSSSFRLLWIQFVVSCPIHIPVLPLRFWAHPSSELFEKNRRQQTGRDRWHSRRAIPSLPDLSMPFVGEHWRVVSHFDKAHFNQSPQITWTDRR